MVPRFDGGKGGPLFTGPSVVRADAVSLYFTVVSSLKLDNEIWDTMFQLPSIPSVGKLFQGGGDCRDFKRYRKLSGHFTGVCGDCDRMRYDVQLCDRAKTDQKGQSTEPIPSGGADDSSAGRHCPNRSDGGRRWRKTTFRIDADLWA